MSTQPRSPPELRILLDQGFPKPRGFDLSAVDAMTRADHFSDAFPQLSQSSTPDWLVYLTAAEAGYDAVVTRDARQLELDTEMFVLSRLSKLTLVTWARAIEDPLREWAQLVAYLPALRDWIPRARSRVILLPAPVITGRSVRKADETLGLHAARSGSSNESLRQAAVEEIHHWLSVNGEHPGRFDDALHLPVKLRARRRP